MITAAYNYYYNCLKQVTTIQQPQWIPKDSGLYEIFLYRLLNMHPNCVRVRFSTEKMFFLQRYSNPHLWYTTTPNSLSIMTNHSTIVKFGNWR